MFIFSIRAVPVLGADPKNCWAPFHGGFNWLTADDGLKRDFQHKNTENGRISARVLLYLSESAWKGRLKVKSEIQHLAYALLEGLQNERSSPEAQRRRVIFIGHSPGGLVIAKATCIAHSEKLNLLKMFEAITGAIFFGTPFGGTPVAPGNATLKELRREFLVLAKNPSVGASMNLFCFIEQHPMNVEKMTSKLFNLPRILPHLSGFSHLLIFDESAILNGYDHLSLAKDHSTLDAPRVAKSRFHSVREYDRNEVKKVLEELGGVVPPSKMYQDLQKDARLSDPSWILKEKECTEGRGKSSAVVSVVDQFIKAAKTGCETSHNQLLYAYLFRGSSHETLSVEQFAKLQSKSKGVTTSFTGKNLWYISGGTTNLLERLRGEIPSKDTKGSGQSQSKIRWLFTSRYKNRIKEAPQGPQTYEINLNEKKKYGAQVGTKLRQHVDQQVKAFPDQKRYNTPFAYFASSLKGARAEDTVWVDITCLRLAEILPDTKYTRIRRELEKIPKNLGQLLDSIWSKILNTDDDDMDEVKEMLRVLILVKEPVTPEELAVFTGFSIDDVRKSLEHLLKRGALLQVGDDERQWQHGLLASRCYIYLRESLPPMKYENEENQQDALQPTQQDTPNPVTADPSNSEHSDIEDEGGVHQIEDAASTTASPLNESDPYKPDLTKLLHYPIKHWLQHADEATPEFAERISREEDFWAQDSMLRKKWLSTYAAVSKDRFSILLASNFTALHTAASLGYAELLHLAALWGRTGVVEELLNQGPPVDDGIEEELETPLSVAAANGQVDTMRKLLARKASVNAVSIFGPVINSAILSGNTEAVEVLNLDEAVGSEEWKCVKFLAGSEKSRGGPNFDEAVVGLLEDMDENLDVLEAIWDNVGVRLSNEAINKALYIATDKEKENTVKLLLNKFEADANAIEDEYRTSLTAAAHDGTIDIVNMPLDRQAEVDAPAGWALQIAAGRGHIEVARRLLLADADANRVIDKPQFPPCTTIQAACEEADVSVTGGESNESPLVFASSFLPSSSAIQLLDAGANINYTDNDGDTPLTMAAWAGDSELVKVLLKRGANPLHVTKRGVSALQYALLANRTECVRVLGDWLSLVLLGIRKAAHAGDEAPVLDVLKRTNYAGLRREVVEMQKAASKQLDEYTGTDFFLDEGVDVRSAGSNDDTHAGNTGKGVDHGDGQDQAGIGNGNRSMGHRNRANDEAEDAKADANEAQDRNGDDDEDVEGEGNDEYGEDRGAENHQNREDDEYTIVQGTAHMRLSEDEGSQSMRRGYDEDNSGNGSDAGDGHDNGEDDNMIDDDEY
ncbi:hypothetical protein QBC32DRAFT_366801 [Pseudoneurospora amorphoporcata]|uniref:DUF676 domain-containing protein n=1 Tax=Pseudoneurospora amorphoporcata TaxID=241081 RepID=A0AAN6P6Z7_9PEZI|nr:hypothetical protein QBC32DRAFT_366801 [Pseudoneurospora amorphoporcata]